MQVWDGLPSSSTVIDPNVVAIWGKLMLKHCPSTVQQSQKVIALLPRQIKERPSVASWDDQGVTFRNRKAIADDKALLAAVDHTRFGKGTEGAWLGGRQGSILAMKLAARKKICKRSVNPALPLSA